MHYYNSSTDKNFINNQTLVEDAKAILVNYYLNISQNAKIIKRKIQLIIQIVIQIIIQIVIQIIIQIVIQIEQIIITLIHIEKKIKENVCLENSINNNRMFIRINYNITISSIAKEC